MTKYSQSYENTRNTPSRVLGTRSISSILGGWCNYDDFDFNTLSGCTCSFLAWRAPKPSCMKHEGRARSFAGSDCLKLLAHPSQQHDRLLIKSQQTADYSKVVLQQTVLHVVNRSRTCICGRGTLHRQYSLHAGTCFELDCKVYGSSKLKVCCRSIIESPGTLWGYGS